VRVLNDVDFEWHRPQVAVRDALESAMRSVAAVIEVIVSWLRAVAERGVKRVDGGVGSARVALKASCGAPASLGAYRCAVMFRIP